jgi:hypothetical protein
MPQTSLIQRTKLMKHVLAIAALSIMAISGANAASFSQADGIGNGDANHPLAHLSNDGQVSMKEARFVGISSTAFDAADADGNGKLSLTEFKRLG